MIQIVGSTILFFIFNGWKCWFEPLKSVFQLSKIKKIQWRRLFDLFLINDYDLMTIILQTLCIEYLFYFRIIFFILLSEF